MALLTKKEFAEKCGMDTRKLAVYKLNGKVVYTGEGKDQRVNDQIEPNKSFLLKYGGEAAFKNENPPRKLVNVRPPKPEEMVEGFIEKEREEAEEEAENDKQSKTVAKLLHEKLEEQVKKLKNENKKLKLGNEKVVGNFIPVEQAKLVIIQFAEAIHFAWETALEEYDKKYAAKMQLTREEITEQQKERNKTINLVKERAIKNAKAMIRRLQNETSDKREVGEHD